MARRSDVPLSPRRLLRAAGSALLVWALALWAASLALGDPALLTASPALNHALGIAGRLGALAGLLRWGATRARRAVRIAAWALGVPALAVALFVLLNPFGAAPLRRVGSVAVPGAAGRLNFYYQGRYFVGRGGLVRHEAQVVPGVLLSRTVVGFSDFYVARPVVVRDRVVRLVIPAEGPREPSDSLTVSLRRWIFF